MAAQTPAVAAQEKKKKICIALLLILREKLDCYWKPDWSCEALIKGLTSQRVNAYETESEQERRSPLCLSGVSACQTVSLSALLARARAGIRSSVLQAAAGAESPLYINAQSHSLGSRIWILPLNFVSKAGLTDGQPGTFRQHKVREENLKQRVTLTCELFQTGRGQ